jgi:putative inorganic carbon (hco3(-)) transporter
MLTFLFTFINFVQPGVLWPALAPFKPMVIVSLLAGIAGLSARNRAFSLSEAVKHPAMIALGVFLLAQVASVYYAGLGVMLAEAGFWYIYLLFVVISLLLLSSIEGLQRYIWGMIAGSTWIVGYGIYAVFAGLAAAVQGRAGAYGMYENHNDYSFIIIMSLPFIIVMRRFETRFLRRAFLGLSLLACVLGIFLSLSRGGVMALVLELILLVIATYSGTKRFVYVAIMLTLGFGAIGYQWVKRAENQGANYTAADAESSRMELWKAGAAMVKAKPLLGVGSRLFGEFGREYGELSKDQIGKNSHNTYIEVIATSGIIGFIAFIMMLGRTIREVRQRLFVPGQEFLEAVRSATLIAIWSIMLRGLLDAKPHDWSFYVLLSIAVSYGFLRRSLEHEHDEAEAELGTEYIPAVPGAANPGFGR